MANGRFNWVKGNPLFEDDLHWVIRKASVFNVLAAWHSNCSLEGMMDATRTKMSGLKLEQGFTLFEMLTVLAVIGVLAAVSIPTVADLMAKQQLKGAARYVMGDFNNYRMLAVKKRHNVCFFFNKSVTSGGTTYTADSTHYGVLLDTNKNKVADSGEQITLKNISDSYPRVTITDATFNGSDFCFKNIGTVTKAGSVVLTSSNGFSRKVVVNTAGSSHVE